MKHYNEQAGLFCMNKGWRFSEQDYSVRPAGRAHDDIYGYSKGGAQKGPAEAGFDDTDWETVTLPHDWVVQHDARPLESPNMGYKSRGIGWYRLRFGLEETDRSKQILLEFEGMSADAEIYVNGMLLKRSYSGYNSFYVDMTDMAHFGPIPNTLAIRIDASAWEGWWYEGAGIYRNVWLLKKESLHIAYHGVYARPEKTAQGWMLHLQTELENSFEFEKNAELHHVLLDAAGNQIAECKNEVQVPGFGEYTDEGKLSIQTPKLWSPETPDLYQIRSSVVYEGKEQDFLCTNTGFRTIAWNADTGFWLNGDNIKLKGFCNHQDHAGVGAAVAYNLKEFRIQKLKDLGANAYRLAHNPDPEILEICDRLGIMVMEENRTFSSAADNLDEVKGIVKRARNHPSVILYSVFNEEPLQGTGKGRRMAGRLQAAVKEMDQTRPVLGAFNGGYLEEDGAATILDGVGINYNPARYDDFHKKFPQIPLMGSETASAFMVRGEYQTDFSQNLIDDYDSECALWGNRAREAWKYVDERPFVAGTFVWTGFDYRGEPTPFEWPSVATFFGTYDSCGFEKDACYLYQAFWKKEPMVHLVSPWRSSGNIGTQTKVMVTTNCEMVRLYINGIQVDEKAVDPYWQVAFNVTKAEGELKAVGYQNGKEAAQDVQTTAGKAVSVRLKAEQLYQNGTAVRSGGHDVIILRAEIVDAQGQIVPDAENTVYFQVKGGRVIGVGNGNPNSHEPDAASHRCAFHGLAQAIIRPDGEETVEICARAEGLLDASIKVNVEKVDEISYIEPLNERIVEGWKLYHIISKDYPDPTLQVRKNDMNTFEPVAFSGHPLPELSGKLDNYAMYRTTYVVDEDGGKLYFCDVLGYVWIYINGKQVFERIDGFGGQILLDVPKGLHGELEITMIVQAANPEYAEAGIISPVFYQK